MPGKLILFLIMIVIVTIFAGFNTTNVCNVSLVFKKNKNVPVFVTVLFSLSSFCIQLQYDIKVSYLFSAVKAARRAQPPLKKETV